MERPSVSGAARSYARLRRAGIGLMLVNGAASPLPALPRGEGQGEGQQPAPAFAASQHAAGCGLTGTPSTSVGERAIRQMPLHRWASASA